MLKRIIKRKQFLFYAMFSLCSVIFIPVHPALSKGEKAVMEFNQVLGVVEIVLVVGSSILTALSFISLLLGESLRAQGEPGFSALSSALRSSLVGAIFILLGWIITGQLTPILSILLSINCAIFVTALVRALLPQS